MAQSKRYSREFKLEAARVASKKWGGSRKGCRRKVTDAQVQAIIDMKSRGEKIARIARTVSLSRLTIYKVIEQCSAGGRP